MHYDNNNNNIIIIIINTISLEYTSDMSARKRVSIFDKPQTVSYILILPPTRNLQRRI